MEEKVTQATTVNSEAGSKKSKSDYEVVVELPSKGILYKEDNIPSTFSLRGMKTREEKILYVSQGGDVFKRILRNCIVSPENVDINKLIAADEMFLVLQLRMVTYGDEYRVEATCPYCKKKSVYKLKLSDFEIHYLDDDFKEPIEFKLPRSGDTLAIRLLRNEDSEFVDRFAKKHAKQFGLDYREVQYVARMAKYIKTINGEPVDFHDALAYVDDMSSMDSAKFWTVVDKILVGVDDTATVTCNECGEVFDFPLPITKEFFRPTVE